ncbi:MAG: hypothetical protein Q9195_007936 [Heterodermia aff. obscurata]
MNSNVSSPKNVRQAPPVTKAADQASTSTRVEASQPYTQSQPSRSKFLGDQAERQPNDYNLNRWLHQAPQDDTWNVLSRDAGQHSNEIERKRLNDEREKRSEGLKYQWHESVAMSPDERHALPSNELYAATAAKQLSKVRS